jgi:S-adenosylmethionine hydrolase
VMAGNCPDARVIDLTHGLPRHDVRAGAIALRAALPYMPVGVHLAVVDPDVGAERRGVAIALTDGRLLVGPDNGLLWPAAQQQGGILEAAEVSRSAYRLNLVSATFHGRDIFSPIAAHLAAGVPLATIGEPVEPEELVRLDLPGARVEDGTLICAVVHVDRFGNIQLSASHRDLDDTGLKLGHAVELELDSGGVFEARYVRTFADAERDQLIVYEDSTQALAIAVSRGHAASLLGLSDGAEVRFRAGGHE